MQTLQLRGGEGGSTKGFRRLVRQIEETCMRELWLYSECAERRERLQNTLSLSQSYIIYTLYPEGSLSKSKPLFASLCQAAPWETSLQRWTEVSPSQTKLGLRSALLQNNAPISLFPGAASVCPLSQKTH